VVVVVGVGGSDYFSSAAEDSSLIARNSFLSLSLVRVSIVS
jgi:hypothetical protein